MSTKKESGDCLLGFGRGKTHWKKSVNKINGKYKCYKPQGRYCTKCEAFLLHRYEHANLEIIKY